jgi:hypothetical protein
MQSPIIGRTIAIAIILALVGRTAFRSLSAPHRRPFRNPA